MPRYGFADEDWERAKGQARDVLISVARAEDTIPYSDLAGRINAIALDPHGYAMRAFLNEISTAEDSAGRGMLSVVVVYKRGDKMPGPGFFDLARALGYTVRDQTEFWIQELQRLYGVWRRGA